MSIKEQIAKVAEKLRADRDVREAVRNSGTPTIQISGLLIRKNEEEISLAMGGTELSIKIEDISAFEESESRPAATVEWPFVTVSIPASATVRETRERPAGTFGGNVGKRPFVYDLPSGASSFAMSSQDFEARQVAWREKVGLVFHPNDTTTYMTASTTPQSTTYDTYANTTTPNDTNSDYQGEDSKSDDQQDYTEDLKDDDGAIVSWRGR
jgi:hypothetical protein